LLSHVVVPVADDDDARATARALEPYDPARITVLYVIEKGGGTPDKTPVEQSKEVAETAFEAFRERWPEAGDKSVYGTDVVEAIEDAALDLDADAIVFRPRTGNRVLRFVTGDKTLRLVTDTKIPVVVLPEQEDDG
jgi:nucleotide-binding universal stress UspA family protein